MHTIGIRPEGRKEIRAVHEPHLHVPRLHHAHGRPGVGGFRDGVRPRPSSLHALPVQDRKARNCKGSSGAPCSASPYPMRPRGDLDRVPEIVARTVGTGIHVPGLGSILGRYRGDSRRVHLRGSWRGRTMKPDSMTAYELDAPGNAREGTCGRVSPTVPNPDTGTTQSALPGPFSARIRKGGRTGRTIDHAGWGARLHPLHAPGRIIRKARFRAVHKGASRGIPGGFRAEARCPVVARLAPACGRPPAPCVTCRPAGVTGGDGTAHGGKSAISSGPQGSKQGYTGGRLASAGSAPCGLPVPRTTGGWRGPCNGRETRFQAVHKGASRGIPGRVVTYRMCGPMPRYDTPVAAGRRWRYACQ